MNDFVGQTSVPPPKRGGRTRALIIMLVILVVLLVGGTSATAYIVNRSRATITITSNYHENGQPAGAQGTTFQVTGSNFAASKGITFLLDSTSIASAQATESSSKGTIDATLMVTSAWSVGEHTIIVKDVNGTSQASAQVTIVLQGQANTPGPNGAPGDEASGSIAAVITSDEQTVNDTLTITGSSDTGTVCQSRDNNQPQTTTDSDPDGVSYTEVAVYSCTGSYNAGKLSYTEKDISDKTTYTNGLTCTLKAPFVDQQLNGTFTDATDIAGTFSQGSVTYTCSLNGKSNNVSLDGTDGSWTGTATMQ